MIQPYYEHNGIAIYYGKDLDVLPEVSGVTACVTDPPYGLNFMGKDWDHGVPGIRHWELALAACLPGAPLMAFGGTRTVHRLVCAIEDAGWEIRDRIEYLHWLYGSGFPKSLDISKAIDKARHDDCRHICRWLRSAMERSKVSAKEISERFGFHPRMVEHWAARDSDSQPTVATWDQWLQLKEILSFGTEMDAEVWRLNGRKGKPGDHWEERAVVGHSFGASPGLVGMRFGSPENPGPKLYPITQGATEAAKQWEGYGTALKPAHEPICLAFKPIEGTFAQNALTYGVAGLNIDGCRIQTEDKTQRENKGVEWGDRKPEYYENREKQLFGSKQGRFPANIIHDGSPEVLGLFPETGKGNGKGAYSYAGREYDNHDSSMFNGDKPQAPSNFNDSGSAARFFYCAKASRSERGQDNKHPTVKPLTLIKYLLTLVTMPGGNLILDQFMGSGTTLVAAKEIGLKAIGIDNDERSCEIAAKRLTQDVFQWQENKEGGAGQWMATGE